MSVYKRGDLWWYKFRFSGHMIRESAKTKSKSVAKDAERVRRRQIEESWNQIKRRTLPPRFDHAADAWLQSVKPHLSERTQDIYEVALRCHLKPALGALLLCDIDANRIASYQAGRKAEGASSRTLNKELQVLRQILKRYKLWASLQGDVRFERESDHIGKAMTEEQETGLLAAEDYVFPSCEAAGIERERPDAERIDPSRPIRSWRTAWRRALKGTGLNIRFHDLRHSCITKLAEGQASEQTLMSIAGHLSRKMIEHYSHIRMAAKRTALDAIVKPVSDVGVAQNWAQPPGVNPSVETVWIGTLAV